MRYALGSLVGRQLMRGDGAGSRSAQSGVSFGLIKPLAVGVISLAKQTRTTMHPRHSVCLKTIGGIVMEQGRIYRLWLNGKLKSGEMTRAMFGLREIRCSIESLPPEPVAASEAPMRTIRVIEIPSGHFFRPSELAQNGFEIVPQLTLERQIEASPIADLPLQRRRLSRSLGNCGKAKCRASR